MCVHQRGGSIPPHCPPVKSAPNLCTPGLTLAEQCVWSLLSIRGGQNGLAYPSCSTIARELEIHPRTVKKATARLSELGFIERCTLRSGREAWRVGVSATGWTTVAAAGSKPSHGGTPPSHGGTPPSHGGTHEHELEHEHEKGGEDEPAHPPLSAAPVSVQTPAEPDTRAVLVRQLHEVAGVAVPLDPTRQQLAGAGRLLEQATADDLVATARRAVAAKPAVAVKVVTALAFAEDWCRVQIAARDGAPPPPDPAKRAALAAAEERRIENERLANEVHRRKQEALLAQSGNLPHFLRKRAAVAA